MRLLYSCVSGQLGGAEISMLDMLRSLRFERHDWEIGLVAPEEGPVAQKARLLGVQVRVIPFPSALGSFGDAAVAGSAGRGISNCRQAGRIFRAAISAAAYLVRLRKAIREFGPDVIHAHGFKMLLLSVWAAKRALPIIWHLHDYVSPRPFMRRLLRVHAFRCTAAIANTASTASDLAATCGKRLDIRTIYYAVDAGLFHPEGPRVDLDRLSCLPSPKPGTIRVGLVATMAHWKGHAVFLRALSLLNKSLPVKAYVIGGALYKTNGSQVDVAELQLLTKPLGLSHTVGFTGFVADSAAAMRSLDIVVHASTKPEPFGLVIAEAMASGRPVIVSESGGAAEILKLCSAGLGFPPGNVTALANRIDQLIREPELREELAARGPIAAARYFGQRRLAEDLIDVYRGVVPDLSQAPNLRQRVFSKRESRVWGA